MYNYNWYDKINVNNLTESFTTLRQLINTEILDSFSFPIECTTCSISFTKDDLNIEIHPMICFNYYYGNFYADCSVCCKYNYITSCDDNDENRQECFDVVKEMFINNKDQCSTCGVTYYGIKWWDGSVYVDYNGG